MSSPGEGIEMERLSDYVTRDSLRKYKRMAGINWRIICSDGHCQKDGQKNAMNNTQHPKFNTHDIIDLQCDITFNI